MIVVIADDLTGAVELAGIGLSHGLKVEVSLELTPSAQADLLVIATDTRSKAEEFAVADIQYLSRALPDLKPSLIFKKVDSVLRGHVMAELRAQMTALGLEKALLVPANPSLGRTIEEGQYLINGKPINETGFANDPEFPVKTAAIAGLLRSSAMDLYIRKSNKGFEDVGVTVGETASLADIDSWASKVDANTLAAGGAGFFKALLKGIGQDQLKDDHAVGARKLFVSGTAFKESAVRIQGLAEKGIVSYMPDSLLTKNIDDNAVENWASEIENKLDIYQTAIIAIHPECKLEQGIAAPELRERTALVIKTLFKRTEINELLIEGGSTAFSVLAQLGIKALYPVKEYATGVVRSCTKENNLYITLKPGSYKWPEEAWVF